MYASIWKLICAYCCDWSDFVMNRQRRRRATVQKAACRAARRRVQPIQCVPARVSWPPSQCRLILSFRRGHAVAPHQGFGEGSYDAIWSPKLLRSTALASPRNTSNCVWLPSRQNRISNWCAPTRRSSTVRSGSHSGSHGSTRNFPRAASGTNPSMACNSAKTEPAAQACGMLAPRYWTGKLASSRWIVV